MTQSYDDPMARSPRASFPSRTRTLPLVLPLSPEVEAAIASARAVRAASDSSVVAEVVDAPPSPRSVRRELDEMSMVLVGGAEALRAREHARELGSMGTTALQHRIAGASEDTLDCYLESLRRAEGIGSSALPTDASEPVLADGSDVSPAAESVPPPASVEPEPVTTRRVESSPPAAANSWPPVPETPRTERSVGVRPRWARTVPLPATATARATPVRHESKRHPASRRRIAICAVSSLVGALVACAWVGFGGGEAQASRARPARPSVTADLQVAAAEPGSVGEQRAAVEAAGASLGDEPSVADPVPAPPTREMPARATSARRAAETARAAPPAVSEPAGANATDIAGGRGVLAITADPDEAVYLNGRLVGWGPVVRIEVDAHSYEVTVNRDGKRQSSIATVSPSSETKVSVSRFLR